ncbi:hypothetical protein CDD80_5837 [Ophiocordyceps camponoti-rufipedis]|uniref:Uncharacterized protein n=1 Tax=Ophiocordyceps camponoti-rufipedis TaxID=2004952 RepID=A0A2C5ZIR2_9HYPO|nr:hypothetical protein CDD80_5837 [Ophiocordyceps camponoti-rufipedis]
MGFRTYAQIVVRNQPALEVPSFVHQEMGNRSFWDYFLDEHLSPSEKQQHGSKLIPRRIVCVPAELAHPQGYFFHHLIERHPEHIRAFAVAICGYRNPMKCQSCIATWCSTITHAREHVLFPFHECVSLQGVDGGSCANCIWNGSTAETCEWRFLSGYQPRDAIEEGDVLGCLRGSKRVCSADAAVGDYLSEEIAPTILQDAVPPFAAASEDDLEDAGEGEMKKGKL